MIGRVKRLLPLVLLVCLCAGCGSGGHSCSVGREVVLRAVPQHGGTVTPAGMKLAQRIMSNRVGSLGVGSPTITLRGSDEIVISGSLARQSIPRVVSATGNLQFFDFEKDLAWPTVKNGRPTPYPTLYSLLSAAGTSMSDELPEAYYLFGPDPSHRVQGGPTATLRELLAPWRGETPIGETVLTVPANTEVVSGTEATFTGATKPVGRSPDGRYWYAVKPPPEISSNDLKESEIKAGIDPSTGQPEVTLGFTRRGAKEFEAITKAEYDRGKLVAGLHGSAGQLNQQYAQHNAIVLDEKLQATPYIDYSDSALSLGIAGAQAVISNLRSTQAANNLALVLQSGSLPYRFEWVSSKLCRG
jgi:preprotein translocase subunit SecD